MTEDRTISLNAVKEMIKGMPDYLITKNAFAYRISVEDLMKGLDALPPVTPNDEEMAMQYQRGYIDGFKEGKVTFEPKTGHWIDDIARWKCSECDWWYRDWKQFNYCPNCGARMVKEQESEEIE